MALVNDGDVTNHRLLRWLIMLRVCLWTLWLQVRFRPALVVPLKRRTNFKDVFCYWLGSKTVDACGDTTLLLHVIELDRGRSPPPPPLASRLWAGCFLHLSVPFSPSIMFNFAFYALFLHLGGIKGQGAT